MYSYDFICTLHCWLGLGWTFMLTFFFFLNRTFTNLMLTYMTDTPYPKCSVCVCVVSVMGEYISIIGMQHNGNAMW